MASDLTHLFKVGQKVKVRAEDDFTGIVKFYDGTVTETYVDHIIVDVPQVSPHMWYQHGLNLEDVFPDYNF